MKMIKEIKINKKTYQRIQQFAIICFFTMFIYSGGNKILNYNDTVNGLEEKTSLPNFINHLGIIGVIILEIIGSLLVILYFFKIKIPKIIIQNILIIFLLFMIVVTSLYHPPTEKIIPFLSNITTFGGFLLIFIII